MMLLQIEQACSNLYECLNMIVLELEHACTNLGEYLHMMFLESIPKTHN